MYFTFMLRKKNMLLKKEAWVIKTASGPPLRAEHSKNMCLI